MKKEKRNLYNIEKENTMEKNDVRKMALLLLDNENGINLEAYGFLSDMLVETGNEDIMQVVDVTESRAYVGEDFAEQEIDKINALAQREEEGGNCHTEFNAEDGENGENGENELVVDE